MARHIIIEPQHHAIIETQHHAIIEARAVYRHVRHDTSVTPTDRAQSNDHSAIQQSERNPNQNANPEAQRAS